MTSDKKSLDDDVTTEAGSAGIDDAVLDELAQDSPLEDDSLINSTEGFGEIDKELATEKEKSINEEDDDEDDRIKEEDDADETDYDSFDDVDEM